MPEATRALTRIADATLSAAIRFTLRAAALAGKIELADQRDPERGSGWIFLGMGKGGAFELNYSSDIDLIVFFDRSRARLADPSEDVDFFVKLTKRIVRIMSERTVDGYVFRTDLRLRPDPGATPIAIPLEAALSYYESMGQNWERAAYIKARPVAGDIFAGEQFLQELAPFVWRKYFDFAAIADVHSIKRQIHAHKGHGKIAVAGHNIKLGRGGIREIEFFVQTQQLITGGRDRRLRGRSTLAMLDQLVESGWVAREARDDLREAYLFLRDVEHRIQMVADEQKHTLPETEDGVAVIGCMMGFAGYADFAEALLKRLDVVQSHYAKLFESAPQLTSSAGNLVFTGDDDDPGTIETLANMGFANPKTVTATIRGWHFGRYAATRSTDRARTADGADAHPARSHRRDGERRRRLSRLRQAHLETAGRRAALFPTRLAAATSQTPRRDYGRGAQARRNDLPAPARARRADGARLFRDGADAKRIGGAPRRAIRRSALL